MQASLQKAVMHALAPLVRLLLRHGISHAAFSNWAKQVYVGVAGNEFGIDGKRPTVSRIAIVTGINRKEVKRIADLPSEEDPGVSKHNRAVRVVTGWLQDEEFLTSRGKPRVLAYGDADDSFNRLVRRYGGDVPARALLDELVRVGTVTRDDARVELAHAGYVPHRSEEALLDLFATSTRDLLTTLEHNLAGEGAKRLQMSVAYDNVNDEGLAAFKRLSNERAMALLRDLDAALSPYDRDLNPDAGGEGRHRTGFGVYYIED